MTPPVIVDLEASGFGGGSYPIEVGTIAADGRGWCSLIRPEPDWRHWDHGAEAIHHIDRDTLARHGKPCTVVADQLNHLLRGQTVYSDGWAQDYVWLARLFDAALRRQMFRLEDLRYVLTPEQEIRWHTVKRSVEAELASPRHRASTDAKVLQLTWLRTRQEMISPPNPSIIKDLTVKGPAP